MEEAAAHKNQNCAKKPDFERKYPSGALLTIYLDIRLPAVHQEAIRSRAAVFT